MIPLRQFSLFFSKLLFVVVRGKAAQFRHHRSQRWRITAQKPPKRPLNSPNASGTRMITLRSMMVLMILFFQTFNLSLADIISAIAFDKTGDFLASGDRAGRVVLFEKNHSVT